MRPIKFDDPEDVYMKGLNTLIQSTASDLVQQAAYDIGMNSIWPKVRLLVHDEIVSEVPKEDCKHYEKLIVKEMTKFKLPTKYGNIPIRTEGAISEYWHKG